MGFCVRTISLGELESIFIVIESIVYRLIYFL